MPEGTAIETFDAFCVGTSYERTYELKINDPNKACLVKIRYKSDYFKATFQVGQLWRDALLDKAVERITHRMRKRRA